MSLFPWARFPAGLSDKPVDEQLAWLLLLDKWHQGKDAGPRLLRAHFNWGGSQADRVYKQVKEWAQNNGGVGPGHNRVTTGSGAPENQPPPPTPEALKKEREIKNSQIPPTPQNPPSPSEPAGEGLGGKENLDFLGRSDREALAKHGIKTIAGLKAAEARNPIRYSKGVGQARADRILAALAAHEGRPFVPDSTDSIDDALANFWKEQPNGPKHATA